MNAETQKRISFRLKFERKNQKLSKKDFAKSIGVSVYQVTRLEAGDKEIDALLLLKFCKVLKKDVDFFTDPYRLVGEGKFTFRIR